MRSCPYKHEQPIFTGDFYCPCDHVQARDIQSANSDCPAPYNKNSKGSSCILICSLWYWSPDYKTLLIINRRFHQTIQQCMPLSGHAKYDIWALGGRLCPLFIALFGCYRFDLNTWKWRLTIAADEECGKKEGQEVAEILEADTIIHLHWHWDSHSSISVMSKYLLWEPEAKIQVKRKSLKFACSHCSAQLLRTEASKWINASAAKVGFWIVPNKFAEEGHWDTASLGCMARQRAMPVGLGDLTQAQWWSNRATHLAAERPSHQQCNQPSAY